MRGVGGREEVGRYCVLELIWIRENEIAEEEMGEKLCFERNEKESRDLFLFFIERVGNGLSKTVKYFVCTMGKRNGVRSFRKSMKSWKGVYCLIK